MSAGARNAAAINARATADFLKRLKALQADFDESARRIVNRAAYVGMAESIRNTPVGVYSREVSFTIKNGKQAGKEVHFVTSGTKVGGTLKKAWTRMDAHKEGNMWISGYTNPTSYAVYVNNGHRVVVKGVTVGYVQGKHMLEIGRRAAEKAMPAIMEAEIARIKRKSGF